MRLLYHMVVPFFKFLRNLRTLPILIFYILDNSQPSRCEVILPCIVILTCISLMISEVEHLFIDLAICMYSLETCLIKSLPILKCVIVCVCVCVCMCLCEFLIYFGNSLFIYYICANIFSQSVGSIFTLLFPLLCRNILVGCSDNCLFLLFVLYP